MNKAYNKSNIQKSHCLQKEAGNRIQGDFTQKDGLERKCIQSENILVYFSIFVNCYK